jgi:hypothetical protein
VGFARDLLRRFSAARRRPTAGISTNGGEGSTPPPTGPPTAGVLLERINGQLAEVSSARTSLTYDDGQVRAESRGVCRFEPGLPADVTTVITMNGHTSVTREISIADTVYSQVGAGAGREPSAPWRRLSVSGLVPRPLWSDDGTLRFSALHPEKPAEPLPARDVDGLSLTGYRLTLKPRSKSDAELPAIGPTSPGLTATFLLDPAAVVRQVAVEGYGFLVTYSDFDLPVTVTLPL